jgi:tetratricopeptide (TPR) repeat protein
MKLLLSIFMLAGMAVAGPADDLISKGDALDAQLRTQEALKVYLEAEKLSPSDASLLIKIAKQHGESMTLMKDDGDKRRAGESALAYSKRALALAPKMADAHLAVAICYGRLLDLVPARQRVEYSRLVREGAEKAIKIDPNSDYAWHMLGRWHQAVATMDGLIKVIVKIVYGGLPDASLEEAAKCFDKARSIKPDRLSHTVELGRTYAMMKRTKEARLYLDQGLAMENKERDDPDTKARGRESLKAL